MAFQVNNNAEIRDTNGKGLGLFASQHLSKGLRVLAEEPLLTYENRDEAVQMISTDFPSLSLEDQGVFTRLYAGPLDIVPFLPSGTATRETQAASAARLAQIARYNGFEGVGLGYAISFAAASLNHE